MFSDDTVSPFRVTASVFSKTLVFSFGTLRSLTGEAERVSGAPFCTLPRNVGVNGVLTDPEGDTAFPGVCTVNENGVGGARSCSRSRSAVEVTI